jgi:hypothetical protein
MYIRLLCAPPNINGKCLGRTDWRRERNRDATVSEFVAKIPLEGEKLGSKGIIEKTNEYWPTPYSPRWRIVMIAEIHQCSV